MVMSALYENDPERATGPEEAPVGDDTPLAPDKGERTGEQDAEENRRREPPA